MESLEDKIKDRENNTIARFSLFYDPAFEEPEEIRDDNYSFEIGSPIVAFYDSSSNSITYNFQAMWYENAKNTETHEHVHALQIPGQYLVSREIKENQADLYSGTRL